MLCAVAVSAVDAGVLAVERVTRLRVIKAFWRRIPVQKSKILPVVIRVAFDTGRTFRSRAQEGSVKPLVPLQFVPNLSMAFDTAKGRRTGGNLMTFCAIGRPVQALVGPGKRSGGY